MFNYNEMLDDIEKLDYTVKPYEKVETDLGPMEVAAMPIMVENEDKAVEVVKLLVKTGKYSSIYITYAHENSPCYYNPMVGHEPTGKDWVAHLE